MTSKKILILAMTLLTAGTLATSCSSEDSTIDGTPQAQQPAAKAITFTATLAPKGDDGSGTRAITTGTDGDSKEILNVAWASGEKIALYYQTASGHAKATAKVTAVDATTGVATISADLDANTLDGGTVKFVYPSTLANDTGDDIDESKLMTQYGKIDGIANSISKKFDAATETGKIHLNGGTALPTTATVTNTAGTGNVSLQSRVCICKFHLTVYIIGVNGVLSKLYSGTNDDLTINDGNGHTYTIRSSKEWAGGVMPSGASGNPGYATDDDIYVAMLPIENKSLTLSASYTVNSETKNLTLTTKPGTLAAGKFYRNVPVTMQLENMDITGDITHTLTVPDGMTVTVNGANINTTSAAAIVLGEGSKLILKGTNTISANYVDAIQCNGNATIEMQSTTNTVTSTSTDKAIKIADGQSLNITGSGATTLTRGIGVGSGATLKMNAVAVSPDIWIPDGAILKTTGLTCGSTVTIASDATVRMWNTTISVTSGPGIKCSGNATIILDGTNTVTTTAQDYPAILPGGSGTTLTIQGNGSLTATGDAQGGPGIGSGSKVSDGSCNTCGNITISGGTIIAQGGAHSAAIGSGTQFNTGPNFSGFSTCGDILINGGTVTATGGSFAAAIGSGYFGRCGSVTITSGVTRVTANKSATTPGPYSIGRGDGSTGSASVCGTITIGGTVYYDGTNFQNVGDTYLATSPLTYEP